MGLNINSNPYQTVLSEEEKEGLLIPTITTVGELNEFEQLNIEKAMRWLIESSPKKQKVLTEKFIRALHKKMFNDVWKWAGVFRKTNKNIGIPWTQISTEFQKLIGDTHFWIQNCTYPEEEIATRFKHRLVSIHCFPNGNGRHSRIMADILMEILFKKKPFNWHRSKIFSPTDIRKKYITALKIADAGNIKPLIEFAKN